MHFWLAYLHPFVDGNGRMARALFYWQMLRSGYDFAQYLSISGPIDKSRRQYYLSFVYTETDDGDLTYFLLHQLQVLRRATEELRSHLKQRAERFRELSAAVSDAKKFNHRQQAALVYSIRNPHVGLTVSGHATSHDVAYLTARRDLQELVATGHLARFRVGRSDRYFPTASLAGRLSAAPR
jgi:Fic family protein